MVTLINKTNQNNYSANIFTSLEGIGQAKYDCSSNQVRYRRSRGWDNSNYVGLLMEPRNDHNAPGISCCLACSLELISVYTVTQ